MKQNIGLILQIEFSHGLMIAQLLPCGPTFYVGSFIS